MNVDPLLHQPVRLRLVGLLHRNGSMQHAALRDALGLTDGNLAFHAQRLADAGYLRTGRTLAGLTFRVVYRITPLGRERFAAYVAELRAWLEGLDGENARTADAEPSVAPAAATGRRARLDASGLDPEPSATGAE